MRLSPIFFCLKLPGRIAGPRVELRRLRVTDGPFVNAIIALPRQAKECGRPGICSWMQGINTWRWMRKTYLCSYVMWAKGRRIGLVGLYGLDSQRSVEVSLLVSDRDRGKGYGRESSGLLINRLSGQRAVRQLRARVHPSDSKTLRFWRETGFRVAATAPDYTTLTLATSLQQAPVYAYLCG